MSIKGHNWNSSLRVWQKIVPTCFACRYLLPVANISYFENIQIVSFFIAGIFEYLLVLNAGILKD
jgi:hypothetical protein